MDKYLKPDLSVYELERVDAVLMSGGVDDGVKEDHEKDIDW